ncbi:MAG: hypothetical protein EA350_10220 [Gemmatimonadales bacterium]|nr:MAG: hypothetical protein EA350_10220 [Gemmatimonadales bacterium]
MQKLVVMLMPYFGRWPEWIDIYLETCRWNPAISFEFFTDCGPLSCPPPPNVRMHRMTLDEFNRRFRACFPEHAGASTPYKLCDLRPAYGAMFPDLIEGSPFFGWGDLDVVYGGLAASITDEMRRADIISFNGDHLSGHLTLVRTELAPDLPGHFPGWAEKVDHPAYQHLDEPKTVAGLDVHARESFNTPLSPLKPWTNGRFRFPREWYWREGVLTSDLDGPREFSHLHFMHWKGGEWPRACGNAQWEGLSRVVNLPIEEAKTGFRVNSTGFHSWTGEPARRWWSRLPFRFGT